MFNLTNAISADSIPSAGRKGRAAKDWDNDTHFVALRDMPVNHDAWYASDETFTDNKLAQKFQSKIAQYAKAGAGTFKTRNRGGKVYICKIAAEYEQQRGSNED